MNETPEHAPIPVVAEGNGWLVADKPAGIETVVPDDSAPSLTHALRQQRANPGLAPIHRLDRDTSGCVLFATAAEGVEALVTHFNDTDVFKCYLGICLGVPREREGRIELPLSGWNGGHRPVRVQPRGGLVARTDFRLILAGEPIRMGRFPTVTASLVAFRLLTGRTHQIRVHAAESGFPLLGDDQYGARPANKAARERCGLRRQALHAFRLGLSAPAGGEPILTQALLPTDMVEACESFLPEWRNRLNKAAKRLFPEDWC